MGDENKTLCIFAGIVSFNPDIEKLKNNISAVLPQVSKLIIIDNGSSNINDIKSLITNYEKKICLICNKSNLGVAKALNQIFDIGESLGAEWILTLDQDSVVEKNLISVYILHLDGCESITCLRRDRNIVEGDKTFTSDEEKVETCITSGNMVNVDTWEKIGKFDEKLFIDGVDTDFCIRLWESGYVIKRVNYYGMLHEIGDGTTINILGRKYLTGNYSAFRKFYIFRNNVYLARKYKLKTGRYSVLNIMRRLGMYFVAIWAQENDKIHKSYSAIKGVINGFLMPL